MSKSILFSLIASILLFNCQNSDTPSFQNSDTPSFRNRVNGTLEIQTTKNNLDQIYSEVGDIINDLDEEDIKIKVQNKHSNVDLESIQSAYIQITKMRSMTENNDSARVIIRVFMGTNSKGFDNFKEISEAIDYYETFITNELEKNNIHVELKE